MKKLFLVKSEYWNAQIAWILILANLEKWKLKYQPIFRHKNGNFGKSQFFFSVKCELHKSQKISKKTHLKIVGPHDFQNEHCQSIREF